MLQIPENPSGDDILWSRIGNGVDGIVEFGNHGDPFICGIVMHPALTSSVVAVAMLGHAALGCCWHHAHAAACDDHQSHCAKAHVHHNPGLGHSGAVDADEHGDEPDHEHTPCQDASCTYLTSKSVELSDAPALPVPAWLALTPSLPESREGLFAHGRCLCPVPAFSPQHCALTQVWRL